MRVKVPNKYLLLSYLGGLFLLLKVYYAYWGRTDSVGGFWNYIQITFIIIAFFIIITNTWVLRNKVIKRLLVFSLITFLTSMFFLTDFSVQTLYFWAMILYAPCVMICYFYIGMNEDIERFQFFLLVFYIIAVIAITDYLFYFIGYKGLITEKGDGAKVYYVIGILPLALIYTRKLKIFPIAVSIIAALLSAKRGAVFAVVSMIFLWIIFNNSSKFNFKKAFSTLIILIVTVVFLYYSFSYIDTHINSSLLYKFTRLSYDGGSGRTNIWASVIDEFKKSNFLNMVFGHGKDSVVKAVGIHAHNDYLEVLYNHGILSVALYVSYIITLFAQLYYMVKRQYTYSVYFLMSIVCSLSISIYSFYIIDPNYITCGMISFGIILSDFYKQRQIEGGE